MCDMWKIPQLQMQDIPKVISNLIWQSFLFDFEMILLELSELVYQSHLCLHIGCKIMKGMFIWV